MSLTYAEAVEAICQEWATTWDALDPEVPYGLPNEAFAPPTDGTAWARVAIHEEVSRQANLAPAGKKRMQRFGRVLVQLAVAADAGAEDGASYVKAARDIFEAKTLDGGIHFHGVSSRPGGTDGRWTFQIVDAPFFYFETK